MPAPIIHKNEVWIQWQSLKLWMESSLSNMGKEVFRRKVERGEGWRKFVSQSEEVVMESIRGRGRGFLVCGYALMQCVHKYCAALPAEEFTASVKAAKESTAERHCDKQTKGVTGAGVVSASESPVRTRKSSLDVQGWGGTAMLGVGGKPGTAIKERERDAPIADEIQEDEKMEYSAKKLVFAGSAEGNLASQELSAKIKCCQGYPASQGPSDETRQAIPGASAAAEKARQMMPLTDTVSLGPGRISFGRTMPRGDGVAFDLQYVHGQGYEFHSLGCDLSGTGPGGRSLACSEHFNMVRYRTMCQRNATYVN